MWISVNLSKLYKIQRTNSKKKQTELKAVKRISSKTNWMQYHQLSSHLYVQKKLNEMKSQHFCNWLKDSELIWYGVCGYEERDIVNRGLIQT